MPPTRFTPPWATPSGRWRLSTQWGVDVSTNNLEAVRQSDLILIGVKPFQVPDLIAEIKPALTPAKTLVIVRGVGKDARD